MLRAAWNETEAGHAVTRRYRAEQDDVDEDGGDFDDGFDDDDDDDGDVVTTRLRRSLLTSRLFRVPGARDGMDVAVAGPCE